MRRHPTLPARDRADSHAAAPAPGAAPAADRSIRSYALFGESAAWPDVLHVETIAARSVLHGWELAPHRHPRLHQLLFIEQGGGRAQLDESRHALGAGSLVNVPTGHVHAFAFSPGTHGWVLSLADEWVADLIGQEATARPALAQAAVLSVPSAAAGREVLVTLFSALEHAFGQHGAGRTLVLRGLGSSLLGSAAQHLARQAGAPGTTQASALRQRFERLLEQHHAQRWRVADYAQALGVSPTHLSRVTRAASGVPASQLIDARRMREARRHLAYTTASVAAVAEQLGFIDPAHFSRVFTRTCGCSPRDFRQRMTRSAPGLPAGAVPAGTEFEGAAATGPVEG
jgi:AraC family transcriptional activator of pobA